MSKKVEIEKKELKLLWHAAKRAMETAEEYGFAGEADWPKVAKTLSDLKGLAGGRTSI